MTARVPLATAAVIATLVAAAACGDAKKTASPSLASGAYLYTASQAFDDGCWPSSNVFPPVGIGLGFTLAAASSTGDTTFTLTPVANVARILPAMTGVRTANAVTTTGSGVAIMTSGCTVAFSTHGIGSISADDRLTIDFTTSFSAATIASNGQPSSCASLQDTTVSGIPFPALTPATNGICSYGYAGILEKS